jgi:hypothetical protein
MYYTTKGVRCKVIFFNIWNRGGNLTTNTYGTNKHELTDVKKRFDALKNGVIILGQRLGNFFVVGGEGFRWNR